MLRSNHAPRFVPLALAALLALGAAAVSSPGVKADHDGDVDSLNYEPHAGYIPPPRSPGRLAPAQGTLLGTHSHDSHTLEPHEQGIVELEQALGRTLDINNRYYGDLDDFVEDDTVMTWMETWDIQNGRIPLVGWGCADSNKINRGDYDDIIRGTARIMKAFKHEFFMRYCWEMDGSRKQGEVKGYKEFNEAWRRMHGIFQEEGATNVIWVWTPNAAGFKDKRGYTHDEPPAPYFYPGDEYVDWIAADGYNWGVSKRNQGDRWRHVIEIFDEFMVFARQHPKPIMIGEYGAQEQKDDPGAKPEWMRVAQEVFTQVKPRSAECPWCGAYSDAAALVYFDVNYGKHGDWRIMSSDETLDAYRISATHPYTDQIQTINWPPAANRPASPPAGPQTKPEPPPYSPAETASGSSSPSGSGSSAAEAGEDGAATETAEPEAGDESAPASGDAGAPGQAAPEGSAGSADDPNSDPAPNGEPASTGDTASGDGTASGSQPPAAEEDAAQEPSETAEETEGDTASETDEAKSDAAADEDENDAPDGDEDKSDKGSEDEADSEDEPVAGKDADRPRRSKS